MRAAGSAPPVSPLAGNEDDLVARARLHDEDAIAALVRLAAPSALAAARRVTGDPALAEDASQEAFLRAFRAIDLMRRRRPEVPLSDSEGSPSSEESRHEDADMLRAALAALSPLDREIMIARELEGASDRELSARFDITLTSVRVRMHRARKKIRARFQEDNP